MQKIRERKAIFDFARHEREVRKTKIIVEQRRLQSESDAKKLEGDLLFNFNAFSKSNIYLQTLKSIFCDFK